MKKILFIVALFLNIATYSQQFTISGYVNETGSKEPLINVSVAEKTTGKGTFTNEYGYYSLTVNSGNVELIFSYIGYSQEIKTLDIDKNTQLNIELSINEIEQVEVTANYNSATKNSTGCINLDIKDIKLLPVAGFQTDIIKSLQVLPGISSGTEGMSALVVRGGNSDQNLVMIDGIPLYHYNHLDGLVSSFSTEAVKSLKMLKSGFPAQYGDRLSSVLDIRLKDGDKNKYHAGINIGLITSGISVEGPIIKKKSSFIISARGFTLQPAIALFPYASRDYFFAGYGFYDTFIKLNTIIGAKDRFYASFYIGKDRKNSRELFSTQEYKLSWGNLQGGIHWNREWNAKLFSDMTLYISDFQNSSKTLYYESEESNVVSKWAESSTKITDYALKWDFNYNLSSKINLNFGIKAGQQIFTPNTLNSISVVDFPEYIPKTFYANTGDIYLESEYNQSGIFSTNVGFRLNTLFTNQKTFVNPEPRAVASLNINKFNSFKASFSIMHQNSHALSQSGLGLKNVFYIPASSNLPAEKSTQYTFGYYSSKQGKYNFSLEFFNKDFSNLVDFKEYVILSDISESWEDKTVKNGTGKAIGAEAFLSIQLKKYFFGFSYTLSKSTRKFADINNGFEFPFDYDRTHDLTLFFNAKLGKKWSYNISWYYMSGMPFSLVDYRVPVTYFNSKFFYLTDAISSKNNVRMENYHRLDISFERKNTKTKKITSERELKLGLYNALNRKNPYYYQWYWGWINGVPIEPQLQKVSLFPIIPYISYSIKF